MPTQTIAQHTPGPWRYHIWGDSSFQRGVVETKAAAGVVICDIPNFEAEEVEANARLIAAAPSMHSALHLAHSYFASHSDGNNEAAEHFRHIGAILAEVEGRDASR